MRRACLALLSFAAVFWGCATTVSHRSHAITRSGIGLLDRHETVLVPLDVGHDLEELTVVVDVRCDRGRAAVSLIDPTGRASWQQDLANGRCESRFSSPITAGRWQCELALADFSGSYTVRLVACGVDER